MPFGPNKRMKHVKRPKNMSTSDFTRMTLAGTAIDIDASGLRWNVKCGDGSVALFRSDAVKQTVIRVSIRGHHEAPPSADVTVSYDGLDITDHQLLSCDEQLAGLQYSALHSPGAYQTQRCSAYMFH